MLIQTSRNKLDLSKQLKQNLHGSLCCCTDLYFLKRIRLVSYIKICIKKNFLFKYRFYFCYLHPHRRHVCKCWCTVKILHTHSVAMCMICNPTEFQVSGDSDALVITIKQKLVEKCYKMTTFLFVFHKQSTLTL